MRDLILSAWKIVGYDREEKLCWVMYPDQLIAALSLSATRAAELEAITRLIYEADSPPDPKDAWKEAQRVADAILSLQLNIGDQP